MFFKSKGHSSDQGVGDLGIRYNRVQAIVIRQGREGRELYVRDRRGNDCTPGERVPKKLEDIGGLGLLLTELLL